MVTNVSDGRTLLCRRVKSDCIPIREVLVVRPVYPMIGYYRAGG